MGARSGRPRLARELEYRFWDGIRAGLPREEAAESAGVSLTSGERWFRQRGGVAPARSSGMGTGSLGFAEREVIALHRVAGLGVREIARLLGRDASTISRELRRIPHNPNDPHRPVYRASTAQEDADEKARRAKDAKLATNLRLRREVQNRLKSVDRRSA